MLFFGGVPPLNRALDQPGVANPSETKSHNFPCAAAKSQMRHVGTHVQNHLCISNDSIY